MSLRFLPMRVIRLVGLAFAFVLLIAGGLATTPMPAPAATAVPAHFVVLGPTGDGLRITEKSVRTTGGHVVQSWPQIGVVVATSTDPGFAAAVRKQPGVDQAGASRNLAEQIPSAATTAQHDKREKVEGKKDSAAAAVPSASAGPDPLEPEQWDMPLIKADKAHRVSLGSKDVTVGVLDFGIDATHPDLAANVDIAKSVSCANEGIPDTKQSAWAPKVGKDQDHGTHVAGTIAAARNGVGITGVAPDVRLASVRVIDDGGFIYPEYAVCGFIWAAEHHFSVTNNSYFVDPWYLWCDSDADQRAGAEAVRRAVAYAQGKDVLNIAAAGNSNWDMSKPIHDTGSPDNGGPTQDRMAGPECHDVPGELPGVLSVSSVGVKSVKSYFSNYGLGSIFVTAPGGDKYQIPDNPSRNGRVLSSIPGGGWGWMQGTSMASPHAVGVAALLRSTHPQWTAQQIAGALASQADKIACPSSYDTNGDGVPDATCEGGDTGAGFYGAGMIDAFDAVK